MKDLIKSIEKIASENPNGFTVKLPSLEFVTSGIISAYRDTQNCFGQEGLLKALNHTTANENILGGWYNSKNNQYYYDSCKIFVSLKEAIEFGKQNEQIAIFDIDNLKEIRL